MMPMLVILTSIFNFDQHLELGRLLLFQVLPAVLVILTIYTIWGIINDMREEENEKEYDRIERLREM